MTKPSYLELESQLAQLQAEYSRLQQVKTEGADHSSKHLLDKIAGSLRDIIIISVDPQYRYLYFNDYHRTVMKDMYGADIALEMPVLDYITIPQDRETARYNYTQALSGNSFSKIERYGDAPYQYYESYFSPILNDHNEIIGATALAINVTGRIKAEQALVESEEIHKALIANIGDVICIVGIDHRFRHISSNVGALLGWTPIMLEATDIRDYIHPEDLERVQSAVAETTSTPQASTKAELRCRQLDHTYRWVESTIVNNLDNEHIRGLLITLRDISERKKAEELIRESEETFRALFEKGPIGVAYHRMIYDHAGTPIDYLFLSANASYKKLTGVDPSGKLVTQAFPGIENEKEPFNWIASFGEVAKTGKEMRFQQYLAANDRWYDCVAYQYKQDHFVAAFLEITEQKRAEIRLQEHQQLLKTQNEEYLTLNEELNERNNEYSSLNEEYLSQNEQLQNAKEKAEESDRLKTAFLQNMSHEIRTPMNAICGFSEMLNDPGITADKRNDFVSIIQNSSKQLLSIVNDILTISSVETKQEKLEIERMSVNTVIEQLHSIFRLSATDKNIVLSAFSPLTDEDAEILTDKTKVTQVLTNLLSNALKFTHKGSVEFGYQLKNGELEFYVKDTGIGIRPEHQVKIFDRFRQADSTIQVNYGGTGLGLAISKGFVELLYGRIWVESEIGRYSHFYFTIPYRPAEEVKHTAIEKKGKLTTKVLVAEDEIYNYMYVYEILEHFDVDIIHAKNGLEAVELCRAQPDIRFVLMDIKMPKLDGYEAAKQIRGFCPDISIVAQSAYALESERSKFCGDVFDDYLAKPIKIAEMKAIIEKYIGSR